MHRRYRPARPRVESWVRALELGLLTEAQLEVLRQMVAEGRGRTLQEAARLLDLLNTMNDLDDGFWGL